MQGTPGAGFHRGFALDRATAIVRKGFRPHVDSYSAFHENDRATPTGVARVDVRRKVGSAAVDAVRYVLSDRCPGLGVQLGCHPGETALLNLRTKLLEDGS